MANECVDEETHRDPGSSDHQCIAATALLRNVKCAKGAENVHRSENDLSNVRILQTSRLEDGSSVVEKEVGTSQLLASLQDHAENGTVCHTRTSEDLVPLDIRSRHLLLKLDADLGDLVVDFARVRSEASELGNRAASLFLTTLAVGETGALWQKQDTSTKDESPEEGETVGNPPRGRVVVLVGAEVHHVCSPDTKSDEELVACHEDSTNDGR